MARNLRNEVRKMTSFLKFYVEFEDGRWGFFYTHAPMSKPFSVQEVGVIVEKYLIAQNEILNGEPSLLIIFESGFIFPQGLATKIENLSTLAQMECLSE